MINSRPGFYKSQRRHFNTANTLQAVAFHLKDALPRLQMHDFLVEMGQNSRTPEELKSNQWKFMLQKQAWLDEGYGECLLRNPQLAAIVREKIFYDDHGSYDVVGWAIIANHVHVILYLRENNLPKIIQNIKSYSAKEINLILGRQGQSFWDRDYFDRRICSPDHFDRILAYLEKQPEKCHCSNQFTGAIPNTDYYRQIFSSLPGTQEKTKS